MRFTYIRYSDNFSCIIDYCSVLLCTYSIYLAFTVHHIYSTFHVCNQVGLAHDSNNMVIMYLLENLVLKCILQYSKYGKHRCLYHYYLYYRVLEL